MCVNRVNHNDTMLQMTLLSAEDALTVLGIILEFCDVLIKVAENSTKSSFVFVGCTFILIVRAAVAVHEIFVIYGTQPLWHLHLKI